jgi:glycosyltransferase involved in cell wall biosynthesis
MPSVSIIIPCYNEERTIKLLLDALRCQTYPLSDIEVVLADGMSTDGTRAAVMEYQKEYPDLRVQLVDNPRQIIPAALNSAIRAAAGEYIIRLDAHSAPQEDYIERCVADLQARLGDNVGGLWLVTPSKPTLISRSIAAAGSHPFGVGDAKYRHGTQAAEVDTVPFGAFRRSLYEQMGGYDETLLTNEDYEFNTRIRKAGGKVWFDPAIRCVYYSRSSLNLLAGQYFRYGYWKWRMLRKYPDSLRYRQAIPPLFVAGILLLAALSIFFGLARWLLGIGLGLYILVLFAGAFPQAVKQKAVGLLVGIPMAIMCMHFAWGSGFLWSMLQTLWEGRTN